MGIELLGKLVALAPEFQRLAKDLRAPHASGRLQVLEEATPVVLASLWRELARPMLVVTPRPEEARRLTEQIALWGAPDARLFPESEALPFERLASDTETTHQRLSTLSYLLAGRDDEESEGPPLVVASISAITQKTASFSVFETASQVLSRGDQIDIDDLAHRWRRMGYTHRPTVDTPGTVGRRGGILDVFPVGAESPVRIELWGDEVDSIREFDPVTQRSTGMIESFDIPPAAETMPGFFDPTAAAEAISDIDTSSLSAIERERVEVELDRLLDGYDVEEVNYYAGIFNDGSLFDFLREDGLVVVLRPDEVVRAALDSDERTTQLRKVKMGRGELPKNFPSSHFTWPEIEGELAGRKSRLDLLPWGADELTQRGVYALSITSGEGFFGNLDRFSSRAAELAEKSAAVVAVTSLPKRLVEVFDEAGVTATLLDDLVELPEPGSITILPSTGAGLSAGFALNTGTNRLALFSDTEIFGVAKRRRAGKRRVQQRRESLLGQLNPGDYVVHIEHGIGRFLGTGQPDGEGPEVEYLILEYSVEDRLYVPMDHLDRITPYVAPMDRTPNLTRLGSQEWQRTKKRVEESTREMASELLGLYARREAVEGHAFATDTPWQLQLEDSFPFEETEDQINTIAEVKADMERLRPMDRLVCGDVGYGKTEIALRAAFKAVMEGKQVAVLVPTTVLAQQHYATFSQRLAAYPVRVEVLSRFRSDADQKAIVEGLASGEVDICIGTHRLVQSDIRFADLGLAVVDEEQRFGVAHKERLKQMRSEVDVLTLTATPIPRTLHMAMAGVRDMSTIMTAPEERMPIKTYVSEFSDSLIREAILREIDRQGQVYFLHNRVHNIDHIALYLRSIVPEATVGVAHGQMPEGELERSMMAFAQAEMDVLVCTTIIESGLDIPNVNTLIVNRADSFGLAQLYQLRGRVGRGAKRAYAYLLIPPARALTETAEKRLKTMLAATELGAGFRIAMADLEIRGAGNILGSQQSGHIHAVGFDLYAKMLADATEQVRAQMAGENGTGEASDGETSGGKREGEGEPGNAGSMARGDEPTGPISVDLGIPASIPDGYIADLPTRIDLYRRLVEATSSDEVDLVTGELRDRFGPAPWQVQNLLFTVRVRVAAAGAGIVAVTRSDDMLVLRLASETGGAKTPLQSHLGSDAEVGNTQIRLLLDDDDEEEDWEVRLMRVIEGIAQFRRQIAEHAAALA
jgi:transcription-repair coupling factor (superfamily II helicase)